jgi:uncharacterized protein (DUF697 family)
MALSRTAKAHIIIHSFATAAATFSAAFALVPVAGPLLLDTAGLTALTVGMTYALASLFGKRLEEGAMWAFGTVALGFAAGNAVFKAAASLIPIYGSAVNATTTFVLHEATGWGLFLIFESGLDPTKMSKKEIKKFVELGKDKARTEKAKYDAILAKLPENARIEVERLQKRLGDKNLSDTQRQNIIDRISKIFDTYN